MHAHIQAVGGFSRTTSLAEYCRTKSSASSTTEETSIQRAQSLESAVPTAAGGTTEGGLGRDVLQKSSVGQPALGFKRVGSLTSQAESSVGQPAPGFKRVG